MGQSAVLNADKITKRVSYIRRIYLVLSCLFFLALILGMVGNASRDKLVNGLISLSRMLRCASAGTVAIMGYSHVTSESKKWSKLR